MSKRDLLIAPLCEGLLLFVVGLVGYLTHKPLVFTSLGPTAYELIETPRRPSARPYNVIVGHLIGVACGFAALALTHAWHSPSISSGTVTMQRLGAAVLAAALTVLLTLLVKATQPAALSTTLLVSLGTLQGRADALYIMAAVVLMTITGAPLRRWRAEVEKAAAQP